MAGVRYSLSETLELRFGYRYFATQDGEYNAATASYASHNIDAGLRFRF